MLAMLVSAVHAAPPGAVSAPETRVEYRREAGGVVRDLHLRWPGEDVRVELRESSVASRSKVWNGLEPGAAIERVDVFCEHDELRGRRRCSADERRLRPIKIRGENQEPQELGPWGGEAEQIPVWSARVRVGSQWIVRGRDDTLEDMAEHARRSTGAEALGSWLIVAGMAVKERGTPFLPEAVRALDILMPEEPGVLQEVVRPYRDIVEGRAPLGDPCTR